MESANSVRDKKHGTVFETSPLKLKQQSFWFSGKSVRHLKGESKIGK